MKPPAFQFYASDWAHAVSALTLEERGAYITLLAWSWEHGPVSDDIKRIAAILGVSGGQARRVWCEVSKKWRQGDDGRWTNTRLERERVKQDDYRAKQSEKGRASANRKSTAVATAVVTAASTGRPTGRQLSVSVFSLRSPISRSRPSRRPRARAAR